MSVPKHQNVRRNASVGAFVSSCVVVYLIFSRSGLFGADYWAWLIYGSYLVLAASATLLLTLVALFPSIVDPNRKERLPFILIVSSKVAALLLISASGAVALYYALTADIFAKTVAGAWLGRVFFGTIALVSWVSALRMLWANLRSNRQD
jgi:hypothetical protein